MAPLVLDDLKKIQSVFCSDISSARIPFNLTRADLAAAVQAIDAWIDANAASFNAAIPLPARTVLTAKQKAELFMRVAQRRFEVS